MAVEPHQQIIVRQMVNDLLIGEMPFKLQNSSSVKPRGRPLSSIVKAFSAVKTNRRDIKRRGRGGRSQSLTQMEPSAFEHAA
ncbi:hypothetical protein [Parasitella parasitica]|uniref:Uncharacterized protein n=1 Tax=Parasitella parasitica TaxID=35722 RepID=A0A0B7MML7_9FUNG|nr:hypothetical protein [Parasitella parasitica]